MPKEIEALPSSIIEAFRLSEAPQRKKHLSYNTKPYCCVKITS